MSRLQITAFGAAGLLLVLAGCQTADRADADVENAKAAAALRSHFWLAPSADAVAAMTTRPGECLAAAHDADTAYLRNVGRAAFYSPFLFGGQAARGGLSCDSCHRDGRGNPDFFAPGLSDKPGAADVTTSVFSKVREDGVFNPVTIPSLIDVGGKETFGETAKAPTLHAFIESAVMAEFQGVRPPDAVLEGLAAYVSGLSEDACRKQGQGRSVQQDMEDAARVLSVAEEAAERGDIETADFLLLSAQNLLGGVHGRYAVKGLDEEREALEKLARAIGRLRSTARASSDEFRTQLASLRKETRTLSAELALEEARSFYDAAVLSAALEAYGNSGSEKP